MKKLYLLVIFGVMIFGNGKGQNLIAVQNGGAPAFYTSLQTAVNSAQTGDTIYIPGGSFSGIEINKKLHLVGVGHNPDSTIVTAKTVIEAIGLNAGADNGSITGIYLYPSITYIYSDLIGFSFNRCNFFAGILVSNNSAQILSNITFNENIIGPGTINLGPANINNLSFSNNIFKGYVQGILRSEIKNNIFLASYPFTPTLSCSYSLLENNIFISDYNVNTSYSILKNNINAGSNGTDSKGNQGSGNYFDYAGLQTIFVNYDPALLSDNDGIYKIDFHLKPDSPYKNGGTDGTDVGIYGGIYPWKEGSIPLYPHFQSMKIAPKTDTNGNLNVKIKVAAQDH